MGAAWGFFGAIFGAIIGAAASVITSWQANRNTLEAQARQDSLERQERAREFQRQTLLEVQEALQRLGRLSTQAHLEDSIASNRGVPWGKNRLSDGLDADLAAAHGRVSLLVERVADDELRAALRRYHTALTEQVMSESLEVAESRWFYLTRKHQEISESLGDVLRRYY